MTERRSAVFPPKIQFIKVAALADSPSAVQAIRRSISTCKETGARLILRRESAGMGSSPTRRRANNIHPRPVRGSALLQQNRLSFLRRPSQQKPIIDDASSSSNLISDHQG